MSKRIHVRPVSTPPLTRKRFKSVTQGKSRIDAKLIHPLIVLADLRRGSLGSLADYLAQEKSIPDRQIALELRKLIAGSRFRTEFRLLVINHPDAEKNKGGRKPTSLRKPTNKEIQVASDLKDLTEAGTKDAAVLTVGERHQIKTRTVYIYAKRVADYEQWVAARDQDALDRNEILERRNSALENLRNNRTK